jgi:hypothetical protein
MLYDKLSQVTNCVRLYATDSEVTPKVLSPSAREDVISRFLFDDDVKVAVLSINLAGESIDLNNAKQVIFYDLPWQSIRVQQAVYRAVRPGSPHAYVDVAFLTNSSMIDSHMFELFENKLMASKLLLEYDPSNAILDELAIINPNELINKTLKSIEEELLW